MKKLRAGLALVALSLPVLAWGAQDAGERPEHPAVVVGTFDSRGVLMAYVRSDAFAEYLAAQKEDVGRAIERARAAGDAGTVERLEAVGPAMQERVHRQGFGTAPVDDVLSRIEDRLPAVALAAGVDVIVSKWSLAYSAPEARFVDVTERLAVELGADEETLRAIRELVATEPVPADQIRDDH